MQKAQQSAARGKTIAHLPREPQPAGSGRDVVVSRVLLVLNSRTVPTAIHHAVVIVRDLDASLRFYRHRAGLPGSVPARQASPAGQHCHPPARSRALSGMA